MIDKHKNRFVVKIFGNVPITARRGLKEGCVIRAKGIISRYGNHHPKYLKIDCRQSGKFKVLDKSDSSAKLLLECLGRQSAKTESEFPSKSLAELRTCPDGIYSVKNCIIKTARTEFYDGCTNCSKKVDENQLCKNQYCAKQKTKSKPMLRLRLQLADQCEEHGIGHAEWVSLFGGNVSKRLLKVPSTTFLKKSPNKQRKILSSEVELRQFSYIEVQVSTNKDSSQPKSLTINDCGKKLRR